MDIIKFVPSNPDLPYDMTLLSGAEIIPKPKSILWIERYRDAGEFEFTSFLSSGLKEALPIGSLISHQDTREVMIIENHELDYDGSSEPTVKITGRSFETFLENRIFGSGYTFPAGQELPSELPLGQSPATKVSMAQLAYWLIEKAVRSPNNPGDIVPYLYVENLVSNTGKDLFSGLTARRDPVYNIVLDLLAIDDLGLKSLRPSQSPPTNVLRESTLISIYEGKDRSSEIMISHAYGDIASANYLWTNKNWKDSALVSGKYVQVMVNSSTTGYHRKMAYIDGSSVDGDYTAPPTGANLTNVIAAMQDFGRKELAKQRRIVLAKAEISRDYDDALYRVNYDLGDIVSIQGDFNESTTMRIIEFVETEDETGYSAYPTLAEV